MPLQHRPATVLVPAVAPINWRREGFALRIVRIFFTKTGEAAYISHLDLQRVMARALRISGLPVWYSQGFNPHIYMSFALPLPLLHESICESVDCKTESEIEDFSSFVQPLSRALPRGIEVTGIAFPKCGAEEIDRALYEISYPQPHEAEKLAAGYNQLQTAMVLRKTKRSEQEIDLKEVLPALDVTTDGRALIAVLPAGSQGHYSPALLTGLLEGEFSAPEAAAQVLRKEVYTTGGEIFR